METRANYLLIGVFSLAGFIGILAFLLWFAKLELNRQFAYYDVFFPDISGLSLSSDVRFAGLSVGQVVDMQLSEAGDGSVRVRLELREDTPVRADSTAGLSPQGVTGTFAVAITAGTPDAPLLRHVTEGTIPVIESSRSMLQTLSDKGPEMIEQLSMVAEDLARLFGEENQVRVANILENVENSTANLDQAIADISSATGSIASAAQNIADFGTRLDGLGEAATVTLSNVDTALAKFTESAALADGMMVSGTTALNEVGDFVSTDLRSLSAQIGTTAARLDTSLGALDETMEVGRGTLGAAERAFEGTAQVIATDIAPVAADLSVTLGHANTALVQLTADLPRITSDIGEAAQAARSAFVGVDQMAAALRSPLLAFATEGLPQFTRMAGEIRALVANLDQMVTAVRRNPPQILSGQRPPEFRR